MAGRQVKRFAALAVPVLALAALGACGGADDPDAGHAPDEAGRTMSIELPASAPGRCMVPTAEFLGRAETAFEGTVTAVGDDEATLEVVRWFRGDEGVTTVKVATPDMSGTTVEGVEFHEGKTYLVSATDGSATLCGYTAVRTPWLEEMYVKAFGAS